MQRCKQQSDIAQNGVDFQSESSADKTYHVQAFRLNEMDHCTCIAFVMKRNKEAKKLGLSAKGISAAGLASDCKHLQEVRRVTCQWTQKTEDEYRWDNKCPVCGGPLVEEGTPMIPEGADAGETDDLKALLAELRPTPEVGSTAPEDMIEAAMDEYHGGPAEQPWRCGNCGVEYPTEAEMQDCEYAHASGELVSLTEAEFAAAVTKVGTEFWALVRTAVETELSETLAPKALAETMDRIGKRVQEAMRSETSAAETPSQPTTVQDDGSPEAAAAALLEHVR